MAIDASLLLIDKYYVKARREDQENCLRGQMYWAPCVHFNPDIQLLRITQADPMLRSPTKLVLVPMGKDAFTDVHKPSLMPPLRWDEELTVFRAKTRPVILFSSETELWSPIRGVAPRPQYFLSVPVYSFHPNHSDRFKAKVLTFHYPDLFYMPADPELNIEEGFVNFGQMQVVPKEWLTPRGICLTSDASELITSWFGYYTCRDQPECLASLISVMLEHHQNSEVPLAPAPGR